MVVTDQRISRSAVASSAESWRRRSLVMMSMLRTVREKLRRLRRLLMEAGSSDEDLIFHIRESDWEHPLSE
jgi:hypothetical protein